MNSATRTTALSLFRKISLWRDKCEFVRLENWKRDTRIQRFSNFNYSTRVEYRSEEDSVEEASKANGTSVSSNSEHLPEGRSKNLALPFCPVSCSSGKWSTIATRVEIREAEFPERVSGYDINSPLFFHLLYKQRKQGNRESLAAEWYALKRVNKCG